VRILFELLAKHDGRLYPATPKGKRIPLRVKNGGIEGRDLFEIAMTESGLDIRIYVMIRLGVSIAAETEKLIYSIKNEVVRLTGIETNSVAIVVSSVISKNTTKRHIEIKG